MNKGTGYKGEGSEDQSGIRRSSTPFSRHGGHWEEAALHSVAQPRPASVGWIQPLAHLEEWALRGIPQPQSLSEHTWKPERARGMQSTSGQPSRHRAGGKHGEHICRNEYETLGALESCPGGIYPHLSFPHWITPPPFPSARPTESPPKSLWNLASLSSFSLPWTLANSLLPWLLRVQ